MATTTIERGDLRALRRKLDGVRVGDDATGDLYVLALDRFLTAAGYQDQVLMRSALEEAQESLESQLSDEIERRVTFTSSALTIIREFTDEFEGMAFVADDQFDDLGRSLSSLVSESFRVLRGFRDGPITMARKHGIVVPNAAKLDEQIAVWEAVKVNLVDCWPWTDAPLPPVDREMVARSRAALLAGERGETIEAVIQRRRSK